MPTMTIKGLPDELLAALRARAAAHRRSVNQEIIGILEDAVAGNASAGALQWGEFSRRSDVLRERLRQQYGTMPDSTPLVREARDES